MSNRRRLEYLEKLQGDEQVISRVIEVCVNTREEVRLLKQIPWAEIPEDRVFKYMSFAEAVEAIPRTILRRFPELHRYFMNTQDHHSEGKTDDQV